MRIPASLQRFLLKEFILPLEHNSKIISLGQNVFNWNPAELVDFISKSGQDIDQDACDKLLKMNSYNCKELFSLFPNSTCLQMDLHPETGADFIVDFNNPIGSTDIKARLVLEFSFIEHIFDQKTAFTNVVDIIELNGRVIHLSPLNKINHGFYNLSLNLFYDFYSVNGFDDFSCYVVGTAKDCLKNYRTVISKVEYTPDQIDLSRLTNDQSLNQKYILFSAKKIEQIEGTNTPEQSFFSATQIP